MENKCLMKLSSLKTELEIKKSALDIPSENLNFANILKLSDAIKRSFANKDNGLLPLAQTIENLKKDLNRETQNRLQAIITTVETILQNNQK